MTTRFAWTALLTLAFAACGSDPLDPGSGDAPGDGTNTLQVEGTAFARPNTPNTTDPTQFTTEFSVRVTLNGSAVTTGTVTVTSRFATTTLTYQDNGRWQGTAANYDQAYQLDVVSGTDEVRGVIVDGPDIHHIKSPTAGAALDSTIANELKWDRGDAADAITFKADKIDRITITDTGTYSIAPGSLKAEKDKTVENTLELRRTNRTVPRGAVDGSDFEVSVLQELDVLALPNPAL